ncbi:AAA domain containing protein [uncultured Caudovirales phage]|uniref:AAA domain containing protein n=1 Tax=uncultured Caudovirales phage TaxID=2100421 RepID=A0A6J5TAC0_9CAUD|nr:AAA domain containing protein [uncultured Caudovirales phage]
MSYFLKSGNTFRVSSKEAMDLHDTLPAGNYVIKKDPFDNLYLEGIESFEVKGKRYGDLTRNCDRILNTFMNRTASTGVMLAGEKGSGKSLLAKAISIQAAEMGHPTIVINAAWTGDKFNAFIQSIEQPCVILFDEFEKVYPSEDQEHILTLLDGVFPSKKLFILTCNDKWRVDSHMRNRPGRIFYMLDFKGLDTNFIIEYCEDNLKDSLKVHIEKICSIASLFGQFNFDMLKALVEEMNRYDEAPEESLRMLNTKPEFDSGNKFTVQFSLAGVPVEQNNIDNKEWNGNPLQGQIRICYKAFEEGTGTDEDPNDLDWEWERVNFMPTDIKKIDNQGGKFVFVNANNDSLVLTKVKEKTYNYMDAF